MLQWLPILSLLDDIVQSRERSPEDNKKAFGILTPYQTTTWNDILVETYG